jgi:hypothetical protein
MKRHLVGLTDDQVLSGYRHRPCYYIVRTVSISKARVGSSTAAAVRDKWIEIVAVAGENKRLQVSKPIPLDTHSQDDGLCARMRRSHSANTIIGPTSGLAEPSRRVEARSEVGPHRSRSVAYIVGPSGYDDSPQIARRERLVTAPVIQHHIIIYPRHSLAPASTASTP